MSDEQVQAQQEQPPQQPPTSNGKRRKRIIIPIVLTIIIAALVYWLLSRGKVSTDDAQVDGHLVPITARVSGYIDTVDVDDNQFVDSGQLLVQLDRRDLVTKLRQATADLATQRAQAAAAAQQVTVTQRTAPSSERQAGAGVAVASGGVAAATNQVRVTQAQAESADAGVQAAREAVASARSDLSAATSQIEVAEAAVKQDQDDVVSAQAQAKKTAADVARYRELFAAGATSKQQLDSVEADNTAAQSTLAADKHKVLGAQALLNQARARRNAAEIAVREAKDRLASAVDAATQARAGVKVARSNLEQAQGQLKSAQAAASGALTAPQQIAISRAQNRAAAARIKQSLANVRNATLQLSYAQITSPVTGVVSQKTAEPGQYVQPGQMVMSVVPLSNVWVVANFKETQVGNMRPGQRAVVTVDSYPGHEFRGRVQSIGAATGAEFSLLPPENATGNFVKVVQRIPVKIVFDGPVPRRFVLRPGQNVEATVYLQM